MSLEARDDHLEQLLQEVVSGEIKCDILPNTAYKFTGELLAEYSAKTGIFRNSVLANMIMLNHQDKTGGIIRGIKE